MKKVLITMLIFVCSFCFMSTIYADNCSNVDFGNLNCEISVGGVLGIGASSCKNTTLKPIKVYDKDNYTIKSGKVNLYGVCYYSAAEKGYFYGAYHDNGKKCYLAYQAFAPNNSKNASKIVKKNSDNLFVLVPDKLDASTGCATYFYVNDEKKTVNFTYTSPGTYEWQDETDLGVITVDKETKDKMKTCLSNRLFSDDYCSNQDASTISNLASSCIKENISGLSDELFNQTKSELVDYIKNGDVIKNIPLYCHLKSKCNITKEQFTQYLSAKSTYSGTNTEGALRKIWPSGKDTLISCIVQNENSEEVKKAQEEFQQDVEESVTTSLDNEQSKFTNFKTTGKGSAPKVPNPDFGQLKDCASLLGTNLTKVVKASIRVFQILGAIIAIVMGMIKLIPAIMSKDADGLKAASKKLVMMAIILVIIFLLPEIIKLIGIIFKFDTTCIV